MPGADAEAGRVAAVVAAAIAAETVIAADAGRVGRVQSDPK